MVTIQEAKIAVDNIDTDISPDRVFINAFAIVLEASRNSNENAELQDIVGDFLRKLPNRVTLNKLRNTADQLETDVMITVAATRTAAINARNLELTQLAKALGIQIEAANTDAEKLTKITGEINKASQSVNTIKTLVSQLNNSDANATARIQAVVTALEKLDEIF